MKTTKTTREVVFIFEHTHKDYLEEVLA